MVQEPEMAAAADGRFRDRGVVKSGKVVLAKTGLSGPEDCLRSVGYLQLGEDVRYVVAYSLGAHKQEFGDHGVVVALGYEVEHLTAPGHQSRVPKTPPSDESASVAATVSRMARRSSSCDGLDCLCLSPIIYEVPYPSERWSSFGRDRRHDPRDGRIRAAAPRGRTVQGGEPAGPRRRRRQGGV